jgi:hypothetical protein
VVGPGVTVIGDGAFADCSGLLEVALPDGLAEIGPGAFFACEGLASFAIPESVVSLGAGAFERCTRLTDIRIPDLVTNVPGYAFYSCTSLTNVLIGSGAEDIGAWAFFGFSCSKPILFNGTVVTATGANSAWMNLGTNSARPIITAGGAIFSTSYNDSTLRGQGLTNVAGRGALVKLGSGTLTIATRMFYTCPTLVSNGVLKLDFAGYPADAATENLLLPESALVLATNTTFQLVGPTNAQVVQTVNSVTTSGSAVLLTGTNTVLKVSELGGRFTKRGEGGLMLVAGSNDVARWTGSLTVEKGVFSLQGWLPSAQVTVPYSSFESEPLLPNTPTDQVKMDKRGTDASGCPGWVFTSSNSTDIAGYQRNNSTGQGLQAFRLPAGYRLPLSAVWVTLQPPSPFLRMVSTASPSAMCRATTTQPGTPTTPSRFCGTMRKRRRC